MQRGYFVLQHSVSKIIKKKEKKGGKKK